MNLCCRPSDSFLDHNVGELVARGPWAVGRGHPWTLLHPNQAHTLHKRAAGLLVWPTAAVEG